MDAQISEPLDLSGKEIVPISTVRAWARNRGFEVGARGHLPESVIARFNRAHRRREAVSHNPRVAS